MRSLPYAFAILLGTISAYFGGKVDLWLQRVMDIFLSFPIIVLALAVVAVLGTGVLNVILAITVPAFFCGFSLWYYQVWILQRINQTLRLALFDRLQALSLRFHAESRIGDAIYRLYQDSAMVTRLIVS